MQALAPITLTGNPQSINLPIVLPAPTTMLVGNESPYALSVQVAGFQKWIHAWTADILPGGTELQVTPILLGSSVNSPSSSLLISIADAGERIPGTYPMALDRLMSLSAGVVTITTGTVSITGNVPVQNASGTLLGTTRAQAQATTWATTSGNFTDQVVTLPSVDTHVIGVVVNPNANCTSLKVTGNQTGTVYLNRTPSTDGPYWLSPILSAYDTTATIHVAASGATVTAYAAFIQDPQLVTAIPNTLNFPTVVNALPTNPRVWESGNFYAPVNVAPTLATDFTLIAGFSNTIIYLHGMVFNTNSNAFARLTLWDGASVGTKKIGELVQIQAAGSYIPMHFDGGGMHLTLANGLVGRLETAQVGTTIYGMISYNQG